MAVFNVILRGGAPWGFRLQGGSDFHEPLRISKINPNSKAFNEGISVGDYVEAISGHRTQGLPNNDAQQLIRQAGDELDIELYRPKSLNGTVNGEPQHISSVSEDQFYTGDSDTSYKSFNPISYGSRSRDYTSPSQESQTSMTITVNSRKDNEFSRPETNGYPVNNSLQNRIPVTNENSFDSGRPTVPGSSSAKPGVWAPGAQPQNIISTREDNFVRESSLKDIVPVWTPGGSTTNTFKKEFKPVKLDTSVKADKPIPKVPQNDPQPTESYAWKPKRSEDSAPTSTSSFVYTPLNNVEASGRDQPAQPVDFTSMNGNSEQMDSLRKEPSRLPPTQSPYITLLQKNRDGLDTSEQLNIIGSPITVTEEGQIPKGAVYLGQQEVIEGDVKHTDEYYAVPSEGGETKSTKVVEKKPKIYQGIGPMDEEGVPLGFRKNVDESKQSDWYKQMFKSLHVTDKKEDTNTYKQTYRFPASEDQKSVEARMNALNVSKSRTLPKESSYKPSYEVLSPKEKAASLERETPGPREKATFGKDLRRNEWAPADAKARADVYKIQPRSIMDYEPGFSSIAFHETKAGVTHNPPIEKPGQFNKYNVGQVRPEVRPLTDQEDDPDVRVAYKHIQKGGEIPYRGLQKPAPDKPVNKVWSEFLAWAANISLTLKVAT